MAMNAQQQEEEEDMLLSQGKQESLPTSLILVRQRRQEAKEKEGWADEGGNGTGFKWKFLPLPNSSYREWSEIIDKSVALRNTKDSGSSAAGNV